MSSHVAWNDIRGRRHAQQRLLVVAEGSVSVGFRDRATHPNVS
jgi:hypothetical protein